MFRILLLSVLPSGLLTQCTDVVSNSLHHKVSRFADNSAVQPWTPGPHLLLACLCANLDLNGTKRSRERSVTTISQFSSSEEFVSMRVCVPAGNVLSSPGDGDGICSRCGGVIFKSIYTISEIFPFTWLLKPLCKHTRNIFLNCQFMS